MEGDLADGDLAAVVAEFEKVLRGPVPAAGDFFSLGGTSLLAVRVVAGVTARSGKLLTLVDLLRLRTPEAVASYLATAPGAPSWMPAEPAGERFELSPAQRWYARVHAGDLQPAGLMAFTVPLPGGTEPAAVWAAMDAMLDRHDALRTVIRTVEGRLVQLVPDTGGQAGDRPWAALHDVPGGADEVTAAAAELRAEYAGRGVPLDGGPLLRAILVRGTEPAADRPAQLAVIVHHLVFDGSSVPVFTADLLAFLAGTGGDLPAATSYRAYTSWRLDRESPAELRDQRDWWARRLAGFAGGCHLPLRGERGRYRGYSTRQVLPEPVRAAVAAAARRHGTPVAALRLAAYFLLGHALHDTDDMVVGMPIGMREHPALRDAVGMFTNHTLLRHRLAPGEAVRDLLRDALAGLTDAADHREHSYEWAMELLPELVEPGRFPITGAVVDSAEADPAGGAPPAEPTTHGLLRCAVSDMQLLFSDAPDRVDIELRHRADVLCPEHGRAVLACYVGLLARLAGAADDEPVGPLTAAAAAELRPVRAGLAEPARARG